MALKVLIIRFSSIGDIVLTTPVIRCLKLQLGSEVHFLTKPAFSSVLENNPYIDQLITLPPNESELRIKLKTENYDAIIDLHNNLRSRRFSLGLSKRIYRFDKLNIQKWLLVNLRIQKMPEIHIVNRYLKAAESLGVTNDQAGLDYYHAIKFEDLSHLHSQKPLTYGVYAIGGQHQTKKLPLESMRLLLAQIKVPLLLLGGKEDAAMGEMLGNEFTHCTNLCGQTSLNESACLIEHSAFVITHDSGMMHIAAAFHKKVISIWGNTVPELGMYPYHASQESRMFEVAGLNCRPCSKIGHKTCPKGHFKCMVNQDLAGIAALAQL